MTVSLFWPLVTWPVETDLSFELTIGGRTETITILSTAAHAFGVTDQNGTASAASVPDLIGTAIVSAFTAGSSPEVTGYSARWLLEHDANASAFLRWELTLTLDAPAIGVLIAQTGDDLRPLGIRVRTATNAWIVNADNSATHVLTANGCSAGVFCPVMQGRHRHAVRYMRNVARLTFDPASAVVRAGGKVRRHALEWPYVPARFHTLEDAADPTLADVVGLYESGVYDDTHGTLEELLDAASAPGDAATLRVYRDPKLPAVDGTLDFGGDLDSDGIAVVSSSGGTYYRIAFSILERVT